MKKQTKPASAPGWEPVLIEKGVITSSGALRIQGEIRGATIRFTFEATDFLKIHVDIKDVKNLIVFAAREKSKVPTHNGKRTFTCRYELVSEKEDNDDFQRDTSITPDLMSVPPAEKNTSAATHLPISSVSTPHIVGTLTIRKIELIVDQKENMTAIVNGNLNKRFRVNHLLLEYEKTNELLSESESNKEKTRITTCFVKDYEDEITLVFPNKIGGTEKTFNVSFVKKKLADSLPRVQSTHNEKSGSPSNGSS